MIILREQIDDEKDALDEDKALAEKDRKKLGNREEAFKEEMGSVLEKEKELNEVKMLLRKKEDELEEERGRLKSLQKKLNKE